MEDKIITKYFKKIGKKGGISTYKKLGKEHYSKIGKSKKKRDSSNIQIT